MIESRIPARALRPLLLALSLALALPGAASAESADLLEEGRRLFEEEVDYAGALVVFMSVVEDDSASPEHRHEARLQASFCLVAMDRLEEAHALLVQALLEEPDYQLPPFSSPKLSEAVEAAREDARERREEIDEERAAQAVAGIPVTDRMADPPKQRSLWPWSAALGTGAAAALGVGAYYGISSRRAQDRLLNDPGSFESQAEALEFRETAVRQSVTGNRLLVSGAALAIGSGLVLLLDGSRASAAPARDGFMLAATFDW